MTRLRDGREIDWARAAAAAKNMAELVGYHPSGFAAPEVLQEHLNACASELNDFSDALCMSKHEASREVVEGLQTIASLVGFMNRDGSPSVSAALEWIAMMGARIR